MNGPTDARCHLARPAGSPGSADHSQLLKDARHQSRSDSGGQRRLSGRREADDSDPIKATRGGGRLMEGDTEERGGDGNRRCHRGNGEMLLLLPFTTQGCLETG